MITQLIFNGLPSWALATLPRVCSFLHVYLWSFPHAIVFLFAICSQIRDDRPATLSCLTMLWNMARFASPVYDESLPGQPQSAVQIPASTPAPAPPAVGSSEAAASTSASASTTVTKPSGVVGVDPLRKVLRFEYPGCKAIRDSGKIKQTILKYVQPHLTSPQVRRHNFFVAALS